MKQTRQPVLGALARRMGILPVYVDQAGVQRQTSDATRRNLLAAMGIDASTEAAAARALEELQRARRNSYHPPARVLHQAAASRLHLLPGRSASAREQLVAWEVDVREEGGGRRHAAGRLGSSRPGAWVSFSEPVPAGYHTLRVQARTRGGERQEWEQSLIVTPGRCATPSDRLGRQRVFGFLAQLYTLRSQTDWGVGDLGDLEKLVRWSGEAGAAFVGLNPLHALANRGADISPYSPVSRLYRNVIYLDVMAVPELAETPEAAARIRAGACDRTLQRLRDSHHVEYEQVMACKEKVLQRLHQTFVARHRDRPTPRGRAYARYRGAQGETLDDFATFLALQRQFGRRGERGSDWRTWPAPYRDPRSRTVRAFAVTHAEEIDFHRYLQFEVDRQLAAVAATARTAGLPVGLYQDLAIGSSPAGSDTWTFPGIFVDRATLGAPPDDLCARGQDWGLPPLNPYRLAADGYRYWIRLVRGALAHAGALRIDHIMGLFRQFWVPAGHSPTDGAYVRFPAQDLLGILALESARTGALVIGEDLGTVPRGLPAELARWGILSTRVLYFSRNRRGTFWPARRYPAGALVSANTHDVAPLAGYWQGRDLELRRRAGEYPSDAVFVARRAERVRERCALLRRLAAEGLLPSAREPQRSVELRAAVHEFLCRTPAALVGITLEDLIGEVEPVNLPGASADRFRSWSRRLRRDIESLRTDPDVAEALPAACRKTRAAWRVNAARGAAPRRGKRNMQPRKAR